MVIIHAHSSHICQPLDVEVFSVFKRAIADADSSSSFVEQLLCMRDALRKSTLSNIVRASFRVSGIYPVNRERPLSSEYLISNAETPTRKRGMARIDGKILTSPEQRDILREAEAKKRRKAENREQVYASRKRRSPAEQPKRRAPRRCRLCRQTGHDYRTCPNVEAVIRGMNSQASEYIQF